MVMVLENGGSVSDGVDDGGCGGVAGGWPSLPLRGCSVIVPRIEMPGMPDGCWAAAWDAARTHSSAAIPTAARVESRRDLMICDVLGVMLHQ